MKDFYEALGLSADATFAAIKKAYFTLVRQYPPERHPEAFMKIREAYEVLINKDSRRQYDEVNSIPGTGKLYFNEGRRALDENNPEAAIRYLEALIKVHRHYSVVNSLLGEAYLANRNSGKAIRIFETLVAGEPDHAGWARRLAEAYTMRGWRRKAIEQYHRALALDEDNLSLWLGLIKSYRETNDLGKAKETIQKGLDTSRRKGWDNLELYCHALFIDIFADDQACLKQHLAEFKQRAVEKEEDQANAAWFLTHLARKVYHHGCYEEAAAAIEAAADLLPGEKLIGKYKNEIDAQAIIMNQMEQLLEDPSSSSTVVELLDAELNRCEDPHCRECMLMLFMQEAEIVFECEAFRKEILRLKQIYPDLYELKKDFFDNILNRKKETYLKDTYTKKLKHYRKKYPEQFEIDDNDNGDDDDDDDNNDNDNDNNGEEEPYRRSGPKVGRNDPCPCGSGKKYKKCCGK